MTIDRIQRSGYKTGNGGDYWFDEEVVYNEKIKNINNINIVISHTNPEIYIPYSGNLEKDFFKKQPILLKDVKKERKILNNVFNEIKNKNLKYWFLGHFHKHNEIEIENVKFIQLDIQDYYELKI